VAALQNFAFVANLTPFSSTAKNTLISTAKPSLYPHSTRSTAKVKRKTPKNDGTYNYNMIDVSTDYLVFDNKLKGLYIDLDGNSYILDVLQAPADDSVNSEKETVLNTSNVAKFSIFTHQLPVPLQSNTQLIVLNRNFTIIEFKKETLYSRYVIYAAIFAGENLP
jgi:hypothetical protein